MQRYRGFPLVRGGLLWVGALLMSCSTGEVGEATAIPVSGPDGGSQFDPYIDFNAVDTVAPDQVTAGQALALSCLPISADGEAHAPFAAMATEYRFQPEGRVVQNGSGQWIAQGAGEVQVRCSTPTLGLEDDSPAFVQIKAGPVNQLEASASPTTLTAGEEVEVRCQALDRFGNPASTTEVTAELRPLKGQNRAETGTGNITARVAGTYTAHCHHPRVDADGPAVTVEPGLPERLTLSASPGPSEHYPNTVITIEPRVADRYNNPISGVEVTLSTDGVGDQISDTEFTFTEEGRFRIKGEVQGPTFDGIPITSGLQLTIDGSPPAIGCSSPDNGESLQRTAEGTLMLQGTVRDASALDQVLVNGEPVTVKDGRFEVPMEVVEGINFADVVAADRTGLQSTHLCSFGVSEAWVAEDDYADSSLAVIFDQSGVDDGKRQGAPNSLADVVADLLASDTLVRELDASLSENPKLKPNTCDESILGGCVLRSSVEYQDLEIRGEPTVELALRDGGLRAHVVLRDIGLRVRVKGHVAGVDYDSRGWVLLDSLDAKADVGLALRSGRPVATLDPEDVQAQLNGLDTDFSGVDGAVVDLVADLFRGSVRGLIRTAIRNVIAEQLASALNALLNSVGVEALGTTIELSQPISEKPIEVDLSFAFAEMNVTPERLALQLNTRMRSENAHRRPSLGAPSQGLQPYATPTGAPPLQAAVHEVVLNQLLVALWRAGFFDLSFTGKDIDGAPAAMEGSLRLDMPPLLTWTDNGRVQITLGAAAVKLLIENLFPGEVPLQVGAVLSADVNITNNRLSLSDLRVDDIRAASSRSDLSLEQTESARENLTMVFNNLLGPMINESALSLPLPDLSLEALPGSVPLGLGSTDLAVRAPWATLGGKLTATSDP